MDDNGAGRVPHRMQRDPLTGLYGRRAFLEMLKHRTLGEVFTVLAADLDALGQVNRRFGYLWGDGCIQTAARRLSDLLPEGGEIFRAEGGTFALVIPGEGEPETLAQQIRGLRVGTEGGPDLSITAGWAGYLAGEDRDLTDTWVRALGAMRIQKTRHAD